MIGDGDRKIWVRGGREKSEFTKKWSDISIIMEMKKGIFLGKEDTEKDGLTKAAYVDHQWCKTFWPISTFI